MSDNDENVTVSVPRWALEYILENGRFQNDGKTGEAFESSEMLEALDAINRVLDGGGGGAG